MDKLFSMNMDFQLLQRLRHQSIDEQRAMRFIVEEALSEYFAKKAVEKGRKTLEEEEK